MTDRNKNGRYTGKDKKTGMKKAAWIVVIGLILSMCVGCSSGENNDSTPLTPTKNGSNGDASAVARVDGGGQLVLYIMSGKESYWAY